MGLLSSMGEFLASDKIEDLKRQLRNYERERPELLAKIKDDRESMLREIEKIREDNEREIEKKHKQLEEAIKKVEEGIKARVQIAKDDFAKLFKNLKEEFSRKFIARIRSAHEPTINEFLEFLKEEVQMDSSAYIKIQHAFYRIFSARIPNPTESISVVSESYEDDRIHLYSYDEDQIK